MKRRGLLGLIAALPIFGRSAEAGPPSFELLPALQPGQQWTFEFERKVVRDGQVMHWYRAPLHVSVLAVDADEGAALQWTEGPQVIVDADPRRRPLLELGLAAMRDVPLVVHVDPAGRVQALLNGPDVRETCLGLLDDAAAHLAARPETAALAQAMLPALKAAYATDAMVAAASLKEPMLLLGAMGRRFGADEPVEFRTTLVNPLGGEHLAAIARFKIRDVDERARRAELGWLMVSDPVATDAAARAAVGRATDIARSAADAVAAPVATNAQALADALAALPSVTLEERGDYLVDTASAWPVRVTHARTVRAGPMAQVEETSFTLA